MQAVVLVVALVLTISMAPLPADAQQPGKMYRIGVLFAGTPLSAMVGPEPGSPWLRAFLDRLRQLGYVYGVNLLLEPRSAEGQYNRLADLAADLVRLRVDVIVVAPGFAATAAKQATQTIPIVFAAGGDAISRKLIASLAHPGGNVTGISSLTEELTGKAARIAQRDDPYPQVRGRPVQPG